MNDRDFMRDYLVKHCLLLDNQIDLSSGSSSSFYFDCKCATLNGDFLLCLSDWILNVVIPSLPEEVLIISGPTMGADFIVAATIMRAVQLNKKSVVGSIVRKEAKQHGTRNKIENEPEKGAPILVVEDVVTSGRSIAWACDELLEHGHQIVGIAAIINRETGGCEYLQKKYAVPVTTLFSRADFPEIK